jgi:hypothetical protein
LRDAALSSSDFLTPQKCQELERQLTAGQCPVVSVPDGIVFDFMNGRSRGRSIVSRNVEKQIGRSDRAHLCDLGDNVHAYWFTGVLNLSCNNVGFVYMAPPPFTLAPPPPAPPKKRCRMVTVERQSSTQGMNFLPNVDIPDCCPGCPTPNVPALLQQYGSVDTSTTQVMVCDE